MIPNYIPIPAFGYGVAVPDRPSPWNSPIPGYWYVSATGSDANGNGTPAAPRQTIPQNQGPGQLVVFADGEDYGIGSGGNLNFTGAGNGDVWVANTSGPIWFVGDRTNKPHMITLDGFLRGSYLWIDGLYWDETALNIGIEADGFAADHVMVRSCEFVGSQDPDFPRTALTAAGFDTGSNVNQVLIQDCLIYNWGDINAPTDLDSCGIIIDTWCLNVWIVDTEIHTCSGSAMRLGGAFASTQSPYNTDHIFVTGCELYNCRQAGVAVKFADLVVVAENDCYGILGGPGGPGSGVFAQYGPLNLWWINNFLHDSENGGLVASTELTVKNSTITADVPGIFYIYAIGNVSWNNKGASPPVSDFSEAGLRLTGGTYRYVVNHTSYGDASAFIMNGTSGTQADGGYFMQNNISANIAYPGDGQHYWFVGELTNSTIANGLCYQSGGSAGFIWGAPPSIGLAAFIIASGANEMQEANPLFTNAAGDDFTLLVGSPAIDQGDLSGVYATYLAEVGLPLAQDIAGTPRPLNGQWDEGAYEFDSGSTPNPPVISSSNTASGTVDASFFYQITTTGGTPDSFSASGLPDGLSINTATGLISGIPTEFGVFVIALGATNGDGTGTLNLTLTIADSGPVDFILTQGLVNILTQSGSRLSAPT